MTKERVSGYNLRNTIAISGNQSFYTDKWSRSFQIQTTSHCAADAGTPNK